MGNCTRICKNSHVIESKIPLNFDEYKIDKDSSNCKKKI